MLGSYKVGSCSVLVGNGSTPLTGDSCDGPSLIGTLPSDIASREGGEWVLAAGDGTFSCGPAPNRCNGFPNIPGKTVANWPFQNSFVDVSGNALNVTAVDGLTPVTAPGFTQLGTREHLVFTPDPCLVGVDFILNSTTELVAPLSPLLQLTGPCTFQWVMYQYGTFEIPYFCCSVFPSRSGGCSPDRIGSLYTLYTFSGTPVIADQFIAGAAGNFAGWTPITWAGIDGVGDFSLHVYAYIRYADGTWRVNRDGVFGPSGVASLGTNVATGTERFWIQGVECGGTAGLVLGPTRILNYARSDADIIADAKFMLP